MFFQQNFLVSMSSTFRSMNNHIENKFFDLSKEYLERLRIAFEAYDRNSDGLISKEDLKDVLKTLEQEGIEVDHTGIERFLKKADLNGDGLIDFHGICCL